MIHKVLKAGQTALASVLGVSQDEKGKITSYTRPDEQRKGAEFVHAQADAVCVVLALEQFGHVVKGF